MKSGHIFTTGGKGVFGDCMALSPAQALSAAVLPGGAFSKNQFQRIPNDTNTINNIGTRAIAAKLWPLPQKNAAKFAMIRIHMT
jgi:hypothetical protein